LLTMVATSLSDSLRSGSQKLVIVASFGANRVEWKPRRRSVRLRSEWRGKSVRKCMAKVFTINNLFVGRDHEDGVEVALTLCQWAGMTVEPARTTGKCPCGQDLDPCGHHLQACQRRTSFMWAHQIWQGFFVNEATAHGLPSSPCRSPPGSTGHFCTPPASRAQLG